MVTKEILESHPISHLRKEISKTNIKGYSRMKKSELIDLMLENKDRFGHIKMRLKPPPGVKREAKPDSEPKQPKPKLSKEERDRRVAEIALNQKKRKAKSEARNYPNYARFLSANKDLFREIEEFERKKGVSKKGAEGVARNEMRKLFGVKKK